MKRFMLCLAIVATMVSGCSFIANYPGSDETQPPIDLAVTDVVGRWRNEQCDGTLVFATDGTFQATNLPREALERLESFTGVASPISVHGTWQAAEAIGTTGRNNEVRLVLEPSEAIKRKSGIVLDAEWRGSEIGLVFYFGGDADLGLDYVYLKSGTASEGKGLVASPSMT